MKKQFSVKKLSQKLLLLSSLSVALTGLCFAATINNPGFESNFNSWNDVDPSSISSVERSGTKSVKISGAGGRVSQIITVDPNSTYQLAAYVRGNGALGVNVSGNNVTTNVSSGSSWQKAEVSFDTGSATSVEVYGTYNGGEGRFDDFSIAKISSQPPASNDPCDNATAQSIGQIEAESFCAQNGIQTQATSDAGGGENVGWIQSGDWTEYRVNVPQSGIYTFEARLASATNGGSVSVLSDGNAVGSVSVTNTGGWQVWQTKSTSVTLPAGQQTIRLNYTAGSGFLLNINWFKLSAENNNPPPPPESCTANNSLTIQSASDNGTNDGNVPSNTIDNNNTTRWSSNGIGKTITYDLGATATIRELSVLWYKSSSRNALFEVQTSNNNSTWTTVLANGQSSITSTFDTYVLNTSEARYLRIVGGGNTSNSWNSILETRINGCFDGTAPPPPPPPPPPLGGLDPSLPPSGNFDLLTWNISVPIDENNDGKADTIKEVPLSQGYTNSNYFYTANDGGMVFKVPPVGPKTSSGTSYVRTELREMLRRGDNSIKTQGITKNNWVFGSAPSSDRINAGGVDGILRGTLAVNQVTTTGTDAQVGRVIFAQIHANDDEPIRFYYRKLPGNSKASIYFAHEPRGANDVYYEMIGSRSKSQTNPSDGIALNEKFSYEIKVVGNIMTVTLIRDGKPDLVETVDMSNSGYDTGGQYMYFKAGAYIQDNTANSNDFAQVTYYALENIH